MNEIEAEEVSAALGKQPDSWPVPHVIVTKGQKAPIITAKMAPISCQQNRSKPSIPQVMLILAFPCRLSCSADIKTAMMLAGKAAALQVTRHGTADAIPDITKLS